MLQYYVIFCLYFHKIYVKCANLRKCCTVGHWIYNYRQPEELFEPVLKNLAFFSLIYFHESRIVTNLEMY